MGKATTIASMGIKDTSSEEESGELISKISQWRQANPTAILTEIEGAVEAELAKLRKEIVEAIVQETAADMHEAPDCPRCGGDYNHVGHHILMPSLQA
jgi:hypothetical protein